MLKKTIKGWGVILLVLIGLSTFSTAENGRFTRNQDGIVTDHQSGLQWQDSYQGSVAKLKWRDAIDYCENLTLGGYNDWRLPNANELSSISDRKHYKPAIDPTFQETAFGGSEWWYWTSTTMGVSNYSHKSAWVVDFDYGYVARKDKSYTYSVRCVRSLK